MDPQAKQTAVGADPAQRKPKGRGHERRDEILGAAARLFVEHGFENVSTRLIADALGISQTTLYVYFPTKDAIFEALCERSFTQLVRLFDAVAAGDDAPEQKLRRLMHAYVDFGIKHSDEYRIAFMLHHPKEDEFKSLDLPAEVQHSGIQCFLKLQEQVERVAKTGALRFEAHTVAQCLWAAGHGLVALFITMPHFPWADREVLVNQLIDIQFRGIERGDAP